MSDSTNNKNNPRSREQIRRLMIAINQIDELYYRILRTLGIKENAFVLLYALADGRPCTQKQICDEWGIPRSTLNTIVQECLQNGYIHLAAANHKQKEICLTDAGKAWIAQALAPIFAAEEQAIAPLLHDNFVEQAEQFTERLANAFSQISNR